MTETEDEENHIREIVRSEIKKMIRRGDITFDLEKRHSPWDGTTLELIIQMEGLKVTTYPVSLT